MRPQHLFKFFLFLYYVTSDFLSSRETVKYFIQEELEPNHLIGNLMSLITLQSNTSNLDFLRFSILYQSRLQDVNGDLTKYFHIDEKTGEIFLSKVIDREQICPGADDCTIAFDVAVKPRSHFQIIKVRVEIADTNDNKPRFLEKRIEHRISESAEPGKASIAIPAATDPDSAENGIQRYFLVPDDEYFSLLVNKINGETNLKLVLRSKLDRETEDQYFLKVYAVDGGKNPLTGSVEVEIVVLDANDNVPIFEQTSYHVSVGEDTPPGAVLLRVRATDADIGANGQVVYRFSSHVQSEHGSLFSISDHTGDIKLQDFLDFETTKRFVLSVTASDLGQDSTPSHAQAVINVEDVNDNSPRIKLNPIDYNHSKAPDGLRPDWRRIQTEKGTDPRENKNSHSSNISNFSHRSKSRNVSASNNNTEYKFSIPENSPPNQLVAHVSVTDADSGENARTTCWLITQSTHSFHPQKNFFRLHQLYSSEFKLVSTPESIFDREEIHEHRVIIVCQDHGLPDQLTSSVQVLIEVSDINDNSPTFSSEQIVISVHENKDNGFLISRIRATDADDGDNGRLIYSMESDSKTLDLIRLDQNSGSLFVKKNIDREVISELKFRVVAKDFGHHPRSSSADVILKIIDVDDEGPKFSSDKYFFYIPENQAPGTSVGVLSAHDSDQPPYNIFHFRLDEKEDSAFMFQLNSKTGLLQTSHILDRENCELHKLTVYAVSGEVNAQKKAAYSSIASVSIHVIDMNDHKPRFLYPSFNETIFLSNLLPVGYLVVQLKAADMDSNENSNLSYYVISGNEDGKFLLDRFSGNLYVDRILEGIKYEEVMLGLKVKDMGDPPLSTYGELRTIISNKISFDHPSTARSESIRNSAADILSDETVAVVLAALLAVILVLISVFSVVIWMFGAGRRRRFLNAAKQDATTANNSKQGSKYFANRDETSSQHNGLLGQSKELSHPMMTSLTTGGRPQTTLANGVTDGGQVINMIDEDNSERSQVGDDCHKPIVIFVREQLHQPPTPASVTVPRISERKVRRPLFRRWENKTIAGKPSSESTNQRDNYTDWYDNPCIANIPQNRRFLGNATIPNTYKTSDIQTLTQPDVINCREMQYNAAMPKSVIGTSEDTPPLDQLAQSIEFHNWLNSSTSSTKSLTKFEEMA